VLSVGVPAGFSTPSNVRQLTATVTAPSFSNVPASLAVGRDLQVAGGCLRDAAPPAPTTVTVSVPAGDVDRDGEHGRYSRGREHGDPDRQSGTPFVGTVFVQGRGLGDTTLTVQAPGYSSTASAVTVQPSGFVFSYCALYGTCDFTTTTFSDDTPLYVVPAVLDPTFLNFQSPQAVRGGLTVSVAVTSATPAVGTIAGSPAVFNPGDSANASTAFAPGAAGTSVLTVGVPAGFSTPSNVRQLTATVTAPSFSNVPASLAVGRDLQVQVDVYVNAAPPAPTTVTVSVPTTSIATVSTDDTVAGGSTATLTANPGTTFVGTVFVQGRGLGDTTLTVQAPGTAAGERGHRAALGLRLLLLHLHHLRLHDHELSGDTRSTSCPRARSDLPQLPERAGGAGRIDGERAGDERDPGGGDDRRQPGGLRPGRELRPGHRVRPERRGHERAQRRRTGGLQHCRATSGSSPRPCSKRPS
jgi:hypothetical protein